MAQSKTLKGYYRWIFLRGFLIAARDTKSSGPQIVALGWANLRILMEVAESLGYRPFQLQRLYRLATT